MFPFRVDILEEHADEAAFLWRQRAVAWESPLRTPASLTFLDERIRAHVDGLVIAGDDGHQVAAAGFKEEEDAGPVFVAALVALILSTPDTLADLERAIGETPLTGDLRSALAMAQGPGVSPFLRKLAKSPDPLPRALALGALAERGEGADRETAAALLRSAHPEEIRAGLTLAGTLREPALDPLLSPHLDPKTPLAPLALEAAFLMGSPRAFSLARKAALGSGPLALAAVELLGLAGEERDFELLLTALRRPETARTACFALGRHGHPDSGAGLVEAAGKPWARAAGQALAVMTGVDLEAAGLVEEPEAAEEPGEEIPESGDDVFDLELDDDYPRPDPGKLVKWWQHAMSEIPPGTRIRWGKPFSFQACLAEAREGRAPDRDLALRECALRLPSVRVFPRRTWMAEQVRTLGGWEAEVNDIAGQVDLRVSRGWPVLATGRG